MSSKPMYNLEFSAFQLLSVVVGYLLGNLTIQKEQDEPNLEKSVCILSHSQPVQRIPVKKENKTLKLILSSQATQNDAEMFESHFNRRQKLDQALNWLGRTEILIININSKKSLQKLGKSQQEANQLLSEIERKLRITRLNLTQPWNDQDLPKEKICTLNDVNALLSICLDL